MGIAEPAQIIASALVNTFKARGLNVEVRYERDLMMDQVVWAVIHGKQKEMLRASLRDLKEWDRSKPVPFLGDGPEIFIGSAAPRTAVPSIAAGTAHSPLRIAPVAAQDRR